MQMCLRAANKPHFREDGGLKVTLPRTEHHIFVLPNREMRDRERLRESFDTEIDRRRRFCVPREGLELNRIERGRTKRRVGDRPSRERRKPSSSSTTYHPETA